MRFIVVLVVTALLLGLSAAKSADESQDKPATPAEQYQALLKEFNEAARVAHLEAKSDDERNEAISGGRNVFCWKAFLTSAIPVTMD